MSSAWLFGLLGGALIGAAGGLLLLTHGRIAGISGISGSLLQRSTEDRSWRISFLLGLTLAGLVGSLIAPAAIGSSVRSLPIVIIAGLLVGFGTRLGSGCTSGHGVCGLSRFSIRSLVSVVTFIGFGVLTTLVMGGVS